MWMGRFRRELDELSQECARAAREEEAATFELARFARAFSKSAREVADDKLAFSATLVRAGEVGAAQRLIHDLEKDVREQQAAIAEKFDQARSAAATRRATMTRLRLARTLAVAVLAAWLLSFSAAGMTVASFVADMDDDSAGGSSTRSGSRLTKSADGPRAAVTRSIRLPDGTRVMLTQDQFRRIKSLSANPNLDTNELERLLIDLVGPRVAAQLAVAIAGIANEAPQAAGDFGSPAGSKVKEPASLTNGGASPETPRAGEQESIEKPQKPSDDSGTIDAPLGSETKVPPVLGGD
jgi:hypothetical protein